MVWEFLSLAGFWLEVIGFGVILKVMFSFMCFGVSVQGLALGSLLTDSNLHSQSLHTVWRCEVRSHMAHVISDAASN